MNLKNETILNIKIMQLTETESELVLWCLVGSICIVGTLLTVIGNHIGKLIGEVIKNMECIKDSVSKLSYENTSLEKRIERNENDIKEVSKNLILLKK